MNCFLTELFNYLNNPNDKSVNYQIAYNLLLHCHEIKNMSIQDLADKCFVSPSTINRFIKLYGFKTFSLFKSYFEIHVNRRVDQMFFRLNNKHDDQLEKIIHPFISESQTTKQINKICHEIRNSSKTYIMGSDEMIAMCLRMQGDFCAMNKLIVKNSIFNNMIIPEKDDFIILLSLTGRILDLQEELASKIVMNNPTVLMIGYNDYLANNNFFLKIPQDTDEVIENMIFDYYIQKITYTYMELFYDRK